MPDIIPESSYIGIDIGSNWIKAAEIRKGRGGFYVSKLARKEIDITNIDTPEDRQKATIETINALIRENKLTYNKVVVALPGYQIFVRKLRVPATSEDRLKKIIQYEARQQIPFPIDKIQIDYHLKPLPESQEMEVFLVGSKKEIVAEYMGFIQKAGFTPKYLDVTPFALFNFQKYIDPSIGQETVALINIGAATTDISIIRDGWISFTRTAPAGGNDLTRNIAKALNIDFAEAEKIKLKQGRVPLEYEVALGIEEAGSSGDEPKIRQAIAAGLDRLVGEIRRTFDYFISQPDGVAVGRVVLSGGTSNLENIDAYLSDKLAIPVSLIKNQSEWAMMNELHNEFVDDLSWSTTAIGLALRSAVKNPSLIQIDFLPQVNKDIRDFKDRRLEISIASALLLGVVFVGSMFGSDEIQFKRQQTNQLSSSSKLAESGYNQYKKLIDHKDILSKQYNEVFLVIGKRRYWLDFLVELNKLTPIDVWFTRLQGTGEYKVTIDGKSLTEKDVTEFLNNLSKSSWIERDKDGKPLVKPTFVSTPTLDPRIDKTVTSFTFELTCKPPKSEIPQ